MYWLTFIVLSAIFYLPPLHLGLHAWRWAAAQRWHILLTGWPTPAWLAYFTWLTAIYLALGTAGLLLLRRVPEDSRARRAMLRLSQTGLGLLDAVAALLALAVLLAAWPVLPAAHALYGWRYGLSTPVAALAGLYLLADALRLAENNLWLDRAFAAQRAQWLVEHGYDRG